MSTLPVKLDAATEARNARQIAVCEPGATAIPRAPCARLPATHMRSPCVPHALLESSGRHCKSEISAPPWHFSDWVWFVFPDWVRFPKLGLVRFVLPKCRNAGIGWLRRSACDWVWFVLPFYARCTRSSYPLMPSRSRGPLRAGYVRACRSRGNVDERQWRFPIAQLRHEVNKFIRKVVTAVPELQR